jgi:hypothetical protein
MERGTDRSYGRVATCLLLATAVQEMQPGPRVLLTLVSA